MASRRRIAKGLAFAGAIMLATLSIAAPTDPLRLVFWALSITGASLFPVMVLSIWWKRLTAGGAIAGVLAGFIAAAVAILISETGGLATPSPIAGILGLPVSLAVALGVSAMRPTTNRRALEIVRDLRIPGGQIIYDREMQKLQLRKHART